MEDKELLDAIECWSCRTSIINGDYYDTVVIFTKPNNISIQCDYKKSKALVYSDDLKDSAFVFSTNVKYLEMVGTLKEHAAHKYKKAHRSAPFS